MPVMKNNLQKLNSKIGEFDFWFFICPIRVAIPFFILTNISYCFYCLNVSLLLLPTFLYSLHSGNLPCKWSLSFNYCMLNSFSIYHVNSECCIYPVRNAEKEWIAERDNESTGKDWEKITRLCDFNPKTSRNTKDTSRMRSILLQVKQTPPASSAAAQEVSS